MRKPAPEPTWGSNGPVSMPQPVANEKAEKIEMEGFCFTPTGIAVDMTSVDREEFLATGFRPIDRNGARFSE